MKLTSLMAMLIASTLISCSSAPRTSKHPVEDDSNSSLDSDNSSETDDLGNYSPHNKTRYQVIQEGFDQATVMPMVIDFDPLDDPSPRVPCVSVKAADPNLASNFVIKQMMVQIAGSADYGPLFPGTVDKVENRLVIGKNNGWVNGQNLTNDMRQVFEIARAPGALVIKINENKFGIYQDVGAPAEVWIRKSVNGHIYFKVYKVDAEQKRNEVFSGYCYHKNGTTSVRLNP